MIGLPEETDDDIDAIALLVTKCKDIFDKTSVVGAGLR